jgi:hypothetical protein
MAHLDCVTPRTGGGTDLVDDECSCGGSPFEPVGEFFELVGVRAVTLRDRLTALDASWPRDGPVDRLGDLLDRRTEEADARLVVPAWAG